MNEKVLIHLNALQFGNLYDPEHLDQNLTKNFSTYY